MDKISINIKPKVTTKKRGNRVIRVYDKAAKLERVR